MATSAGDGDKLLGELVPQGGGDPIPLRREKLLVGRRETCDIILRFGNVSSNHCELTLEHGYWFVKDLGSRNGTRLNGYRITKKRMDPGDTLSIAKRDYKAKYSPAELGAEGPPPDVDVMVEIMSHSLLEGAGLARKPRQKAEGRVGLKQTEAATQETNDDGSGDSTHETEEDPNTPSVSHDQDAEATADLDTTKRSGSDAASTSAEPSSSASPSAPRDRSDDENPDEYRLAPE